VCVAVVSVVWVCEPWWVASAVVAVATVRGRSSSTRGSAVLTPAVVVSGDASTYVCRLLGLSFNQIRGSFPSVVSGLSSLSAWSVYGVHVWCTVCICSVSACAACVVLFE
jgi:hypothetical protein